MEPDNIKRPGHQTFVILALSFVSICVYLTYWLLSIPVLYYVLIGIFVLLVKKYVYGKSSKGTDLLKDNNKINVCVVGAGFSGLCMGVKLKKAGINFKILEKGSEVGGTWTANQYPGCRCDVWSVLYQVRNKFCC